MINPTDLRLNNLVDLGNRYGRVIEIHPKSCIVVDLEDTQDTLEDYERLSGIPLTGKILLDSGFIKEEADAPGIAIWDEYYLPNRFEICDAGVKLDRFHYPLRVGVMDIFYVHELQNLYWMLYKKELNIIIK